jgi:hypothetical protein
MHLSTSVVPRPVPPSLLFPSPLHSHTLVPETLHQSHAPSRLRVLASTIASGLRCDSLLHEVSKRMISSPPQSPLPICNSILHFSLFLHSSLISFDQPSTHELGRSSYPQAACTP